ncbi:alpha/beta-hydrolase [Mycena sp. CBHHK59/15]|nr:alpha/beta-hydrolase [Mycena sp. CBHHK59/15]
MPTAPSTVKILHSSDGTVIYAEATGDPQPTRRAALRLWLNGCVFDDLCANARLLQMLYIVRYDVRGHGRSGKSNTAEAYVSKLFADDFKTVMDAFDLDKPVLEHGRYVGNLDSSVAALTCMIFAIPVAVATDVVTHLAPGTLSGVSSLAGIPSTGTILAQMAAPELVAALPGLIQTADVRAYGAAGAIFIDKCFAHPDTVSYAVRCMYQGHSLTPEIMELSLNRPMDVENLWRAGEAGLPLLVVQGTADGHRACAEKTVEEVTKPHFKNYAAVWLEGRGHAVHYECLELEDVVDNMIAFATKCGGKVS